MQKIIIAAMFMLGAAVPFANGPAWAQTGQTEGEVRKVDKAQGKVTLRHGPVAEWNMGGMTMVFQVPDRSLLDKLKEGDKGRFTLRKDNQGYWLLQAETQ